MHLSRIRRGCLPGWDVPRRHPCCPNQRHSTSRPLNTYVALATMELQLNAKIQNPRIILGFPGFGLVGSIATEFLISHLKTEKVGRMLVPEMPAMVAIHQKKVVDSVSLYYDREDNLLL